MKNRYRILLVLFVFLCLALPSNNVMASELAEGKVVFGGTYQLESGESLDGDLVIFGAATTLMEDSVVEGDVVIFGANLDVSGEINGDVVSIGGLITLNDTAKIDGDVITIGANMDKSDGALITGDVLDVTHSLPNMVHVFKITPDIFPEVNIIWFVLRIFLWAALATLIVLFVPNACGRVAQAFTQQPLIAGGLGLLTIILAIPLTIIFIITIIFSPLGLFLLLVLGISWAFGLISIGLEIGKRLVSMIKRDWADPVSAFLGTFILIFVLGYFNQLIPCIGWMFSAVVGMIGLGAVIMTRFGTQSYTVTSAPPLTKTPAPVSQPPVNAPVPMIEEPEHKEEPPSPKEDKNAG